MYNSTTIEVKGLRFRVNFPFDCDASRPWEDCDGHGPVRQGHESRYTGNIVKRPGERVLHRGNHREYNWVYDWQAACKLARQDGWNTEPYDAPNRVERAVQADFDYLAAWCAGYWHYVGVIVTHVTDAGDKETDAIWGVETWKDFHEKTAQELAEALADSILKEDDERGYWEQRDIVTQGATA